MAEFSGDQEPLLIPEQILVVSERPRAINGINGKEIELFEELDNLFGQK